MKHRGSDPPSKGDGSVPLELARRLLVSHYPYSDAKARTRIFVGQLPEDPPFEVPIPSEFTLLGSVASETSRGRPTVEAVLDTVLPAERARDVYRELLTESGWIEERRVPGPGGFVRGPHGFLISLTRTVPLSLRRRRSAPGDHDAKALFRFVARKQTLLVSVEERLGAPTDVRLHLIAGRNQSRFPRRRDPVALSVMPLLTPPPRTKRFEDARRMGLLAPPLGTRRLGGGFGVNRWEHDGVYSFAAIETDLDLASLTAHYATQLEDAGWSRRSEGGGGPQAWNTWTFSDRDARLWEAAFTALHLSATPRRYLLHLRADRMPDR